MKALIVPEAGRIELADIPVPEPGTYDALVRNEVCGICSSTDSKLVEGRMFWAPPFPIVLGHESCGVVIETGAGVRNFKIGDRVTRSLAFWPGTRSDMSPAMGGFCEFGIVRDGSAMAEDGDSSLADDYNVQRQLVMPPDLKPVEVALAISLAETASVLRHLPNLRGRTVAVTGAGTAGLAFMLWCKLAGARVVAIARREESLMEARAIAADLSLNTDGVADPAQSLVELAGGPVDGIIEATGAADLADALLPAISPEGFATAYGVPPTGASYNARWESPPVEEHLAMDWVCDMIRRKLIEPPRFYSHTWSLDEFEAAFAAVTARKVKKAFLRIAPDPL